MGSEIDPLASSIDVSLPGLPAEEEEKARGYRARRGGADIAYEERMMPDNSISNSAGYGEYVDWEPGRYEVILRAGVDGDPIILVSDGDSARSVVGSAIAEASEWYPAREMSVIGVMSIGRGMVYWRSGCRITFGRNPPRGTGLKVEMEAIDEPYPGEANLADIADRARLASELQRLQQTQQRVDGQRGSRQGAIHDWGQAVRDMLREMQNDANQRMMDSILGENATHDIPFRDIPTQPEAPRESDPPDPPSPQSIIGRAVSVGEDGRLHVDIGGGMVVALEQGAVTIEPGPASDSNQTSQE